MKNFCEFIIVIGILIVAPTFATANDLLSQPPILEIYESDGNNNVISLYDQIDNEISERIVEKLDHLRLECRAYYPVQWIYTGNGITILNISLSKIEKRSRGLNQYIASAFLSPLSEYHTGEYRCSRTAYNSAAPYIYIYVPGPNLFTSPEAKTIKITNKVSSTLIPCSVSHPNIQVLLYKLDGQVLRQPVTKSNNAIAYNPRKGFRVNLRNIDDPEGTYVCTARYKNLLSRVEYTITSKSADFEQVADNIEEFKQNPEETCRGEQCKQCETHTDCPPMMHCYTDYKCRDPCTYSISCGKASLCRLIEHRPECYCPPGFLGDPTKECYNISRERFRQSEYYP